MARVKYYNAESGQWEYADLSTGGKDGEPGAPGKSAYEYAKDGGYTGTEAEFAAKLAKEIPTKTSDLTNNSGFITEAAVTVKSVNGKAGAVTLSASDVGADASGTAGTVMSGHNVHPSAHNDIRLLITGLTNRLDALANADDDTLDQMAEVVAYIKANRDLIEQITTNKVNVADIINNLTTNVSNKPLSAAQGVALKALIDAIPEWAKAASKPGYTASEVGAVPTSRTVNGKALGANISLSASDVGARASTWTPSAAEIKSALGYTPANQATTITITGKDADGNTHTFTVAGWEA